MSSSSQPHKPVIGLAGGIGSGKSLVARQLAALGCGVISADALAREALEEPSVRQELRRWWGRAVDPPAPPAPPSSEAPQGQAGCEVQEGLEAPGARAAGGNAAAEAGPVDRRAVARIIFEDPRQRQRLEALIHPRVHARRHQLCRQMQDDPQVRAIVEDCPLLYEAGIDASCDVVIFVAAPRAVRLARVAGERGWSEAELEARERAQLPLDIKAQRADYVIDNGASEQECMLQVRRVLSRILHDGQERKGTASAD